MIYHFFIVILLCYFLSAVDQILIFFNSNFLFVLTHVLDVWRKWEAVPWFTPATKTLGKTRLQMIGPCVFHGVIVRAGFMNSHSWKSWVIDHHTTDSRCSADHKWSIFWVSGRQTFWHKERWTWCCCPRWRLHLMNKIVLYLFYDVVMH